MSQAKLGVSHLPECMCDVDVLPAMCPTIRHACETFPRSAEAILAHHGLDTTEFNTLQERVKSDMLFRWRVQMKVSSLHHELQSNTHAIGANSNKSSPTVGAK
jgi:hypothetical protein